MNNPYQTGRAALPPGTPNAWLATVCLGVVALLTLTAWLIAGYARSNLAQYGVNEQNFALDPITLRRLHAHTYLFGPLLLAAVAAIAGTTWPRRRDWCNRCALTACLMALPIFVYAVVWQ